MTLLNSTTSNLQHTLNLSVSRITFNDLSANTTPILDVATNSYYQRFLDLTLVWVGLMKSDICQCVSQSVHIVFPLHE